MEHTTGATTPLEPRVLALREMLELLHRAPPGRRAQARGLRPAQGRERAHLLLGFLVALDNIDRVIAIIRDSDTVETARDRLIEEPFVLSDAFRRMAGPARRTTDFRLSPASRRRRSSTCACARWSASSARRSRTSTKGCSSTIDDLNDLLAKPARILAVVRDETADLKKRLGDPRKTPVEALEGELSIEDIIADTEVVVTATVGGYIKRVSVDTFRAQNRGGRGVIGISNLKKEDVVRNFFVATTHQYVLFFTNKGRAFRLRAYEIPDSTRQARGTALVNLLQLPPGEIVTAVFPVRAFDTDEYLVMVTRRGVIKKTKLVGVRERAPQRPDRDRSRRRRRTARGRPEQRRPRHAARDARRDGRALQREGRAADGPPGARRQGDHARTRRRGRRDGHRRGRPQRGADRHLAGVRQTHADRRLPPHLARRQRRQGVRQGERDRPRRRSDSGRAGGRAAADHRGNQVIRIPVSQIRRAGRSTKGVRLQRLAEGDEVIAIANLGQQSKRVADITGEEPPKP